MRRLIPFLVLFCACGAFLVESTMPNPARATQKLHATQEFDQGPYKENHRYRITVTNASPNQIEAEIKLVDFAQACALIESYTFTLVDDRGNRRAFRPSGAPERTTEAGHDGAVLTVSTVTGQFDGPIAADARAITIEVRKVPNVPCSDYDFRWRFE